MTDLLIGLQLYTVRDQTEKDFAGVIRQVAQMGYAGVEFAGYGNLSAKEMAALLSETGLRAASTHIGIHLLDQDADREIDYCLEIGSSFLVVPWIAEEYRSGEGVRRLAERLNTYGQRCQERGITLGYHNHDFEFKSTPEGMFLDNLMAQTDPAFVKLELDTYWAAFAGVDPTEVMRKYAGRVPLIHLKDMTPERTFTEVGDGTLDISSYRAVAQEVGTQWGFVENDSPAIPSLESVRRSFDNLKQSTR